MKTNAQLWINIWVVLKNEQNLARSNIVLTWGNYIKTLEELSTYYGRASFGFGLTLSKVILDCFSNSFKSHFCTFFNTKQKPSFEHICPKFPLMEGFFWKPCGCNILVIPIDPL
jgi:hypothetical protein